MSGQGGRAAAPPARARARETGGFEIRRGDAVLRLPDGTALVAATAGLAEAIAAEIAAAPGDAAAAAGPSARPLFRLQATLQGRVRADRDGTLAHLLGFDCDLLCYRAAGAARIAAREEAVWRPLLDWAEARLGARFRLAHGVMPVAQPAAIGAGLAAWLAGLDDHRLAGLTAAVPALGSLVLGLALVCGRIGPVEAADASLLDQFLTAERWGEMAAHEAARDRLAAILDAVTRFLALAAPAS